MFIKVTEALVKDTLGEVTGKSGIKSVEPVQCKSLLGAIVTFILFRKYTDHPVLFGEKWDETGKMTYGVFDETRLLK